MNLINAGHIYNRDLGNIKADIIHDVHSRA